MIRKLLTCIFFVVLCCFNSFASKQSFEQQINMNLLPITHGTIYELEKEGKSIYYHTDNVVLTNDIKNINNLLATMSLKKQTGADKIKICRYAKQLRLSNDKQVFYFTCSIE